MKKEFITIILLLLCANAFGQQTVDVDLALGKPDDINVNSGSVELNLINVMPNKPSTKTYKVTTSTRNTLPFPISLPIPSSNGAQSSSPKKLDDPNECPGGKEVAAKIADIFNTGTTEELVKKNFDDVDLSLKNLQGDCLAQAKLARDKQDALRRQTQPISNLSANQVVTVTITRYAMDGKTAERIWEFKLTTEKTVDAWLIHYGFTYAPNVISSYPQYFAKADPTTANSYTITKANGHPEREWQNASPSIAFTHPFSQNYHGFMPAATIITGTNFSTYSAGIGLSGLIAYNGLISCGVMYTQKYALNGQYKEGDIIKDNLNFEQLHYKRGCIELFFTIAIRLDKNPFSAASSSSSKSSDSSGGSSGGATTKTPGH